MANHPVPVEGVVGGYKGSNFAIQATLSTLLCLAFYNAIELIIIVLWTFHTYRNLYFWSLIITAALGVAPQSIGLLIKYFQVTNIIVPVTLSTLGWCIMVTGHSLVLYSRLHLVLYNKLVLRAVLYMILADIIILQVPQIVLSYCAVYGGDDSFANVFSIWEKVQMIGFFIQEVLISSIFIVQAARLLRDHPNRSQVKKNIMYQVMAINVAIIFMDVTQLTLEYLDLFMLQTVLKTFFYSVKLKLEIAVLSKLVVFVHSHNDGSLRS